MIYIINNQYSTYYKLYKEKYFVLSNSPHLNKIFILYLLKILIIRITHIIFTIKIIIIKINQIIIIPTRINQIIIIIII